ncbi:hypothetical protein JHW43_009627 [Diplocarpon mali]|nr:hypothetical protein JHW43_009627 [Diplocarpon mali]
MRCPRDRASPGLPQVSPRSSPVPSSPRRIPHPECPRSAAHRRVKIAAGSNVSRSRPNPFPSPPSPRPPPPTPASRVSGIWHLAPGTSLERGPPPPFQELDSGRVLRRRHCRAFVFARSICGAGHDARSGESAFSPGCSPRRPEGRRGKAGPAECLRKSRPRLLGCSAARPCAFPAEKPDATLT